ncbi:hypothetical protein BX600DRAFT_429110 [Xylariales sp. PMI_506]|nr:hypothetical protein BX600DRAFT_429110 [Xylariales sp. PMI_506]
MRFASVSSRSRHHGCNTTKNAGTTTQPKLILMAELPSSFPLTTILCALLLCGFAADLASFVALIKESSGGAHVTRVYGSKCLTTLVPHTEEDLFENAHTRTDMAIIMESIELLQSSTTQIRASTQGLVDRAITKAFRPS